MKCHSTYILITLVVGYNSSGCAYRKNKTVQSVYHSLVTENYFNTYNGVLGMWSQELESHQVHKERDKCQTMMTKYQHEDKKWRNRNNKPKCKTRMRSWVEKLSGEMLESVSRLKMKNM